MCVSVTNDKRLRVVYLSFEKIWLKFGGADKPENFQRGQKLGRPLNYCFTLYFPILLQSVSKTIFSFHFFLRELVCFLASFDYIRTLG